MVRPLPSKNKPLPIATLPMLNGKVYVIWSPVLAQAALRNPDMTFDVFALEFAQRVFGASDDAVARLRGERNDGGVAAGDHMRRILHPLKAALAGQHLFRMNVKALNYVAERLNAIDPAGGLEVENLYDWLRQLMTMATAEALYGAQNPARKEPGILDAEW